MKVRIYRTPEGEVIVDTPSKRYQGENLDKCPHPGRFRNGAPFEMEVMEMAALEALVGGKNEAGSAQFYHDGELKHDHDWDEVVMPEGCVIKRHRAFLEEELDTELAKNKPDPVLVVKKDRELRRLGEISEQEVYALALDKLVKEGKKPNIQEKLRKKLGLED